jgi:deoxyribonuclease-4
MIKMKLGCHLSVSAGYAAMGETALSIDANTFQFFTRNPRGGAAKELVPEDVAKLMDLAKEHEFAPLLGHAPYTLNPCSADARVRQFAHVAMEGDLDRLQNLPGSYYNFHPGSHVGQGVEKGIAMIVDLLNEVIDQAGPTTILLETMSGKGSEVGSRFEELKMIIDQVKDGDKLGVCLDTCHVYDAGYDIKDDLDGVLETFDRVIGLAALKAIHLNDSKNPFHSKKDRHEKIGEGTIGLAAIERIINHPLLRDLPFYLETPNDVEGYAKEISLLRSLYRG